MQITPNSSSDTTGEERYVDLKTWFKVDLEYPEIIKELMKKQNLSLKSVDELAFLRWIAFMKHQDDLDYWFEVLAEDLEKDLLLKDVIDSTNESILDIIEPSSTWTGKAKLMPKEVLSTNCIEKVDSSVDMRLLMWHPEGYANTKNWKKLKEFLEKMPAQWALILD